MLYPTISDTARDLAGLPADVLILIREACPPVMMTPDQMTAHARERREWASLRVADAVSLIGRV